MVKELPFFLRSTWSWDSYSYAVNEGHLIWRCCICCTRNTTHITIDIIILTLLWSLSLFSSCLQAMSICNCCTHCPLICKIDRNVSRTFCFSCIHGKLIFKMGNLGQGLKHSYQETHLIDDWTFLYKLNQRLRRFFIRLRFAYYFPQSFPVLVTMALARFLELDVRGET